MLKKICCISGKLLIYKSENLRYNIICSFVGDMKKLRMNGFAEYQAHDIPAQSRFSILKINY